MEADDLRGGNEGQIMRGSFFGQTMARLESELQIFWADRDMGIEGCYQYYACARVCVCVCVCVDLCLRMHVCVRVCVRAGE